MVGWWMYYDTIYTFGCVLTNGGDGPTVVCMASPLLYHQTVTDPHSEPTRRIGMLHGSFGSGRNLGKFAKQLLALRPNYAATLIDLPGHGKSSGVMGEPSLRGCAELVAGVAEEVGGFDVVLGHSLGGKIALHLLGVVGVGLESVWVIDSTPAVIEERGEAQAMLDVVAAMPDEFVQRAQAVAMLEEAGVAGSVAQWMATNLEREEGGGPFRWRFDRVFMQGLLDDFYGSDLWGLLEGDDGAEVHFVRALGSGLMTGDSVERIRGMEGAAGRVNLHEMEGGHWLHVDNPGGLSRLIAERLPR